MRPAVAVPCPTLSLLVVVDSGAGGLVVSSKPATNLPARSGWVGSTPESRSATTIEADPLVVSHAAGAPTLFRYHWLVKLGSLGVAWKWRTRSGLTFAAMPARARVAPAWAGSPEKCTTPGWDPLILTFGWPSACRAEAAAAGSSTTVYDCD